MAQCFCPMSDVAIQHIRALSESYRLMIAAANDYNGIALANRKQIELAIERADHLGSIIEDYLCSWENCSPCLVYSCGWEYCRRNLEVLNAIPNLPKNQNQNQHQHQHQQENQNNTSTEENQTEENQATDNREHHYYHYVYENPPQLPNSNGENNPESNQNKT